MSFEEILAEVPKLSQAELERLWSELDDRLHTQTESPEFLAELDRRVAEADSGCKMYTLAEVEERLNAIEAKYTSRSSG
jgi:hypothetical protein